MSPQGVHCWHVKLTSKNAACTFLSCFSLRFVTVSPFTMKADGIRSENHHGNLSAGIMDALLSGQRSCSCEPGAGMLNTLDMCSSVDSVAFYNICYDPDGPERLRTAMFVPDGITHLVRHWKVVTYKLHIFEFSLENCSGVTMLNLNSCVSLWFVFLDYLEHMVFLLQTDIYSFVVATACWKISLVCPVLPNWSLRMIL